MNAYALYTVLRGMLCSQVKEAARELGLSWEGRKSECIARILQMAADPLEGNNVVAVVSDIINSNSRRRQRELPKPRAMRSLLDDFDKAAEAWAAQQAAAEAAAKADIELAALKAAAEAEAEAAIAAAVAPQEFPTEAIAAAAEATTAPKSRWKAISRADDLSIYMPTKPDLDSPSHGPRVRDVL